MQTDINAALYNVKQNIGNAVEGGDTTTATDGNTTYTFNNLGSS